MTEKDIALIIDQVLAAMGQAPQAGVAAQTLASTAQQTGDAIEDVMAVDLRTIDLVDAPHDQDAYMALKERTPARLAIGHAGARCRTWSWLRFQADHAAAMQAVFTDVPQELLAELGLPAYTTLCTDRDNFLTRPDLGRRFDEAQLSQIKRHVPAGTQVALYVADGLSSRSVVANARDLIPTISQGLKGYGVSVSEPFFVRFGRVGSQDAIGEATDAQVVCTLIGERPGLVTADSMSAYICYQPRPGMPESRRTVVANIHKGGTPAVEAGAHIVDLIKMMLDKKASGTDLPI